MTMGITHGARRLSLVALVTAITAAGLEFHVATTGADTHPGTPEAPFATLTRARDAIRQLQAGGGPRQAVTVVVRGGTYSLATPLTLGAEDSGTAAAPVVYRAQAGEQAILIGGRVITDWQPHRGAILKADVGAQGFQGIAFQQLL